MRNWWFDLSDPETFIAFIALLWLAKVIVMPWA